MDIDKIDRKFAKNTNLYNVQETLDKRLVDLFSYT